ncbi:MAG: fibronectin type III domain-containing protein [Candidatus Saccharibacteria bacterium]
MFQKKTSRLSKVIIALILVACMASSALADTGYGNTTPQNTAPTWPPGAKIDLTYPSATTVTVKWTPAVDNNGVIAYYVYAKATTGVKSQRVAGTQSVIALYNLTPGIPYTFEVYAIDAEGSSSVALSKAGATMKLSNMINTTAPAVKQPVKTKPTVKLPQPKLKKKKVTKKTPKKPTIKKPLTKPPTKK